MKPPRLLPYLLLGLMIPALIPACAPGEWPVTGSLTYRDERSGAKAGLVFEDGKRPAGMLRVPIRDQETGEVIGLAELRARRRVEPAK